jgi:hypothetical protein
MSSNWLQVRLGCIRLSPSCPFRLLHTFLLSRPARRYPRFRIQRPSSERRGDFNPHDSCAAQRTLWPHPTPHPRTCSSFGCCLHEPVRNSTPDTDEVSQVPCKERLHVHKVSDCARFIPCQPFCACDDVAFRPTERRQHLGIRPISQLNTWPVVSPVNASR